MLKMSHNQLFLWPIYLAKSLFARPFVVLFFLVPSISKPPAQPVRSLVLGLLVVPPSLDSHPVIVQPYSPPCESRSFAWLTQTSFGMLFSDMDFFLEWHCLWADLIQPIRLCLVSLLSVLRFVSLCFFPCF